MDFLAAPTFQEFARPGLELESFVAGAPATAAVRLRAWPALIHIGHLGGRLTLALALVLLLFGYRPLDGAGGRVSAASGLAAGYAFDFDLQETRMKSGFRSRIPGYLTFGTAGEAGVADFGALWASSSVSTSFTSFWRSTTSSLGSIWLIFRVRLR